MYIFIQRSSKSVIKWYFIEIISSFSSEESLWPTLQQLQRPLVGTLVKSVLLHYCMSRVINMSCINNHMWPPLMLHSSLWYRDITTGPVIYHPLSVLSSPSAPTHCNVLVSSHCASLLFNYKHIMEPSSLTYSTHMFSTHMLCVARALRKGVLLVLLANSCKAFQFVGTVICK